jgi:hypothetical protein
MKTGLHRFEPRQCLERAVAVGVFDMSSNGGARLMSAEQHATQFIARRPASGVAP